MRIILALIISVVSGYCAPAFVQGNYDEAIPTTGLTVPFNSTTTAGNFLVVGMRPSDGSQNLTVTAGGQTFTRVANAPIVTEYSYSLFILYNAPAVNSIVMTGGDTADQQRGWALEFSGMPTSGNIEDFGTGSGTSTTLNAGNVDTLTSGALLIMAGATDSDEFHTDPIPSAGWTMVDLQTCCDDDKTAVMFRVAGAAGNYGGTMTESQGPSWSAIIGAFSASGADTTAPTLSSATIPSGGTTISLAFTETVSVGAGGNAGWTISMTGGAATLTYSSGSGTSTLVYSINRTINSGETGTVAYTQPGNGIEDTAGNDLATIGSSAVTNNSSQSGGGSSAPAKIKTGGRRR